MFSTRRSVLVRWIPLFLLASCGSPKVFLLHEEHRLRYALEDSELLNLQYFISRDVLAHLEAAPDVELPPAETVFILEKDTPGLATEVGPDWVRVRFRETGPGAYFLASSHGGLYLLANESPDGSGLQHLGVAEPPILYHDGQRYRILEGAVVALRIDEEELQELIDKRTHLMGVRR